MTQNLPRPTDADALRALIRELAATDPHPRHVAARILAMHLGSDELLVVADAGLSEYCRRIVGQPHLPPFDGPLPPMPEGQAHPLFAGDGADPMGNPSPKWAGVRDAFAARIAAQLNRSINVADTDYKYFGDCTAEHCDYAAKTRHDRAAATLTEAARFERVAAELRDRGVSTVRELPEELLRELLL